MRPRRLGLRFRYSDFFSWLGITLYLTEEAFDGTLKFVLSMPRSTEIVLDFMVPDRLCRLDVAAVVRAAATRIAAQGEPIIARFIPEELATMLEAKGFSKVVHLSARSPQ